MDSDLDFSKVLLKPEEVDTVIYHGNCTDGFASALAAYIYAKRGTDTDADKTNSKKTPLKIEYIPAYHGKNVSLDLTGKNVLICDFSYKSDILKQMIQQSAKLLVLDHHKSAEIELQDIPDTHKVFCMHHSGAYITWKYFFQEDPDVPLMIKYVEDNDIWTNRLPFVREFTSFIYATEMTFEKYEQFLDPAYVYDVAIPTGKGMMVQNRSYIAAAVKSAVVQFVEIDNIPFFVALVNTSVLKSEIGNAIMTDDRLKYVDFAVCYSYNDALDVTNFSLRSTNDHADVSLIATKFNGGGHRNASATAINGFHNRLPWKIIDGTSNSYYRLLASFKAKFSKFGN